MREAVIVEAVRTPIARGKPGVGDLSAFHAGTLLGKVQDAVVERAGVDPAEIEQVVGGCVTQAGEQSNNITRVAWLNAQQGLAHRRHHRRHAVRLGAAGQSHHLRVHPRRLDRRGHRVRRRGDEPRRARRERDPRPGLLPAARVAAGTRRPTSSPTPERIAQNRGITREDVDRFGARVAGARRARATRAASTREILPIDAPGARRGRQADRRRRSASTQDQGIRPSTLEGLAKLKPVREGGIHTPGNSSQISDGAAARAAGCRPRRRASSGCARARGSSPTCVRRHRSRTTCSTARSTPRARSSARPA